MTSPADLVLMEISTALADILDQMERSQFRPAASPGGPAPLNPGFASPAGTKHRLDFQRDRQGRTTTITITKL